MSYIWQSPDWPDFRWEDRSLIGPLARLAEARGRLQAELATVGLDERRTLEADALVGEALGTSGIEGQVLPPASVRASVARRLGLESGGLGPARRDVDGLVKVLLDATGNATTELTAERTSSPSPLTPPLRGPRAGPAIRLAAS